MFLAVAMCSFLQELNDIWLDAFSEFLMRSKCFLRSGTTASFAGETYIVLHQIS